MYKNYFFVLFLHLNIFCDLINAIYASEDCNKVGMNSNISKLKRDLFCEYDSNVRPVVTNKYPTHVRMMIMAHFIKYDHNTQIFSLHTTTTLLWEDMHLTWSPIDYDDIDHIKVSCNKIWVPDIIMHNRYKDGKQFSSEAVCLLLDDGGIIWVSWVKYTTYCIGDTTWWPYDQLNCTLQLGSWSNFVDEIDFGAYELNQYEYNITHDPEWSLLKIYKTEREEEHKYNLGSATNILSYHFIMRRNWGIVYIAYVTPTIVLMVMTLIALWLEPKSTERMIIANLNFVCHLLCLKDVHREVPKSGYNIPKLIIFYESSFAMASFTLILTSILRYLQELRSEPPGWISAVTLSISHSKVGQILLVSVLDPVTTAKIEIYGSDNTDLVQVNNKKSSWTYVTVLIGWLALLSISLAYIILLSISFPVNL